MKQSIVLFIVAGFALTAYLPATLPSESALNDKLAEIQAHRTGLRKRFSVQYQGLDLAQKAAEFHITSVQEMP